MWILFIFSATITVIVEMKKESITWIYSLYY
jgi:hypothetical protein